MFKSNSSKNKAFDDEIKRILEKMKGYEPDTAEYATLLNLLDTLIGSSKKALRIPPELIVGGIVNLVGIVAILNFERVGVITSRAFNLIKKV